MLFEVQSRLRNVQYGRLFASFVSLHQQQQSTKVAHQRARSCRITLNGIRVRLRHYMASGPLSRCNHVIILNLITSNRVSACFVRQCITGPCMTTDVLLIYRLVCDRTRHIACKYAMYPYDAVVAKVLQNLGRIAVTWPLQQHCFTQIPRESLH
jgi:hypothetical protein